MNLVDQFYNVNSVAVQPNVNITSDDQYGTMPAMSSLVSGRNTFTLTLITAATSHIVTATNPGHTYLGDTSAQFTLAPSTPSQLQVLVPGETAVPGLPPYNGTGGKSGTPLVKVAGDPSGMQITVNLTDIYYNRITNIDMPSFGVNSWDSAATNGILAKTLNNQGTAIQIVNPQVASSTWTVTAFDTALVYSSNTSSNVRIWPAAVYYFTLNYATNPVVAGTGFDVLVKAYDQYRNFVSTGPSWDSYVAGSHYIQFLANNFPAPRTPTVPLNYYFVENDFGQHNFVKGIVMRKADDVTYPMQWFKCFDASYGGLYTSIASDRAGYASLSFITINPGSFYKISVSTDPANPSTPTGGMLVPAGSPSNPGNVSLAGQMVDPFNNGILSSGVTVYFNVADSSGNLASVQDTSGKIWVSTTTDANGSVGVYPSFYVYVSTHAGDYSRIWIGTFTAPGNVSSYIEPNYINISGRFITTGGDPYCFGFQNMPTNLTAGKQTPSIQVYRYDGFGNPTEQGQDQVTLFSESLSPNKAFYNSYDNPLSGNQLVIQPGDAFESFYYYDDMSSYPIGENDRPGAWILHAQGDLIEALGSLIVDPNVTTHLDFSNTQSTQVANTVYDNFGVTRALELQPQDQFGNPTISTTTSLFASLSTVRLQSPTTDYWGFSLSSGTAGGTSWSEVTQVEIATNTYFVNFYYKDTRASNTYVPPGSGPTLSAVTTDMNHYSGSQVEDIIAAPIYKIAFSTPTFVQTLTAGTTTGEVPFTLQTQDAYSNPSPIVTPDTGYSGVRLGLSSNSQGARQYYTDAYGWQNTTGTILITTGTTSSAFSFVDTITGGYVLSADVHVFSSRNWQMAQLGYNVQANVPYKLAFINPGRRLIAGTTIEYYPDYTSGVSTDTRFTVQLQDFWSNRSTVTAGALNINVLAASPPLQSGAQASSDNNTYYPVDPNQTPLNIATLTPGQAEASFYFKSNIVGTVPVTAWINGLQTGVQITTITPNTAQRFSFEHPYSISSPLPVLSYGPVTVQARDLYGNAACGDPINGNYYNGKVLFWNSGSTTTANMLIAGVSTNTFTFSQTPNTNQPVPGELITLQVMDTKQETIRLGATDYVNSNIYGYTSDQRDLSNSGDVVTVGIVMTPQDFAPESNNPAKQNIGIATSLYQGDGTTPSRPGPVPMIRMQLQINPVNALVLSSATWIALTVNKTYIAGTSLGYDSIAEVDLYRDANGDGMFEGDTVLGNYGSATDEFLSSGTFVDNTQNTCTLIIPLDAAHIQQITQSLQTYFICVRLTSTATKNATLQLTLPIGAVTPVGVAKLAVNNFPFSSFSSTVQTEPPSVYLAVKDIASWYDPDGVSGPLPLAQYPTIQQGNPATGMMKIGLWTPEYNAIWTGVDVIMTGTAGDNDVVSCMLYSDDGTGIFKFGGGSLPISPPSVFNTGIAHITLNTPALIAQATQYFYIVYQNG